MDENTLKRFTKNITYSPQGECWVWSGNTTPTGYGMFYLDGKKRYSHRISHEHYKGSIPEGHVVMHICDNPSCVNPDHLITGTQAENMRDKLQKGRQSKGEDVSNRGMMSKSSKLTDAIVLDIRNRYTQGSSAQALSDEFGVSRQTIWKVVTLKSWSHVTETSTPSSKIEVLRSRFLTKVDRPDDPLCCWNWQASRFGSGYGAFGVGSKVRYAHRLSWELHYGPIPDGMVICHQCDNRRCVRPEHLFLGTIAENNKDMRDKGRGVNPPNPLHRTGKQQ